MRRVLASLLGCAAALWVVPAQAQDYAWKPERPVTIIVPWAAGGSTDQMARVVASELEAELGQRFVVVNQPGASGSIGTKNALEAAKDGYTIALTNNAALVFRSIMDPKSANYDPFRDLTPLGLGMRSPSILVVGANAPFKDFKGMIAYAKGNPGKVRIGTAGVGSVGDFCVQTINSLTGAGLVMVPHKGAAPAVTAVRGGHIEGVVLALGTMTAHLKSGAVRGIGTLAVLMGSAAEGEFANSLLLQVGALATARLPTALRSTTSFTLPRSSTISRGCSFATKVGCMPPSRPLRTGATGVPREASCANCSSSLRCLS